MRSEMETSWPANFPLSLGVVTLRRVSLDSISNTACVLQICPCYSVCWICKYNQSHLSQRHGFQVCGQFRERVSCGKARFVQMKRGSQLCSWQPSPHCACLVWQVEWTQALIYHWRLGQQGRDLNTQVLACPLRFCSSDLSLLKNQIRMLPPCWARLL